MTIRSRAGVSAYYGAPVAEFLSVSDAAVLGSMVDASAFALELPQRDAWRASIAILKSALKGMKGHLYLEFDVPRLGSRIDAVFIAGGTVLPIEFKVGESEFNRADLNQVWDYALDLKNFHSASHGTRILPLLVATDAEVDVVPWGQHHPDGVWAPACCNAGGLRELLMGGIAGNSGAAVDGAEWGRAPYKPTPTIIEAARALYARHSVEAISRSEAGAHNIAITSRRVEQVIDEARELGRKAIVFVTGVPGAGKTLVGLNIATKRRDESSATHAVFLSGNAPLVAVLREALIRDGVEREAARGRRVRKGHFAHEVKQFIQNVHRFRDDGIRDADAAPSDRVVIFDEAQRAWNRAKTADFMRRRKNLIGFEESEPQFLIGYMDRHPDWAVVVCLVGGGQEIHTGEAGIHAWLEAIRDHFPEWSVFVSPELGDSEYGAVESIRALPNRTLVHEEPELHLSVSMRSFRAEHTSQFVRTVLDCELGTARQLLSEVIRGYPIAITRELDVAKEWIRRQARGSERVGLLASSQAARLKPHAVDIRVSVNPIHWFLNNADDTRSSDFLEDAATEFQVQGLEVDWACVMWDADLRFKRSRWNYHQFRGSRWVNCRNEDRQRYMLNAYRVLLTRARQGMVIFVPRGDHRDPTRIPGFYDGTFDYFAGLGAPVI